VVAAAGGGGGGGWWRSKHLGAINGINSDALLTLFSVNNTEKKKKKTCRQTNPCF
jgi:hypothetical protein